MLPIAYRSSLRTLLIRRNSSAAKPHVRFGTHLLAGISGGAAVIATGYTWYYFSGLKNTVDRVQEATFYLEQTRVHLSKGKSPSQALVFLRKAVESYVVFPGSNILLDMVFVAMEQVVEAHADGANAAIATAYNKISNLIQQDGGKLVTEHSIQILGVLNDLRKQLVPTHLGLEQKRYEVEKRVNEGLATAGALRDAVAAKVPDLMWSLDRFRKEIGKYVGGKPANDDGPADPPQIAAGATDLGSDDDSKSG